jgi:precorrin-2/cobalt-factor-2 C20-methyltransferase
MSGTLYGLGVGPGDPELITLKALRIIEAAPVIAYPAPDVGDSLARAIAEPHIPAGKTEIAIRTPMVPGNFPAHDVYDRYAVEIGDHLATGRDVAVLCEGDPFLYGSFMYVFARLAGDYETRVVPGVSSLGACAAAAGVPLVSRNETLAIVPGPLDEAEMESRIRESTAVAVMKVGKHLDKIRRVIERLGLSAHAHYVEHASMTDQRVLPLDQMEMAKAPYFSMILIRREAGESGI